MAAVAKLRRILTGNQFSIGEKHKALFALRNIATEDAARALEDALVQVLPGCSNENALLKHEIAYALGQVGLPSSAPILERVLGDVSMHAMVRHEVCAHDARRDVTYGPTARLAKLLVRWV
jgi:deoxyhypusine monooxygenase